MIFRILMLPLLILSCGVNAEIYKWTDEQGNTHYGDKPDTGKSASQLNVPATEDSKPEMDAVSREERKRRLVDELHQDRLKKQGDKKQEQDRKEQLNKQCVNAKDKLKQYEEANALYNLDKNGNRIVVSDEQKATVTRDLQNKIRKECGV